MTIDEALSKLPEGKVKIKESEIQGIAFSQGPGLAPCLLVGLKKAIELSKKLNVGTVQINGRSKRSPDQFPFTCMKDSGIGTQGIKYSIEASTRIKTTIVNIY